MVKLQRFRILALSFAVMFWPEFAAAPDYVYMNMIRAQPRIPAPGLDAVGLAWDGEHFWGSDRASGAIKKHTSGIGWENVPGWDRGTPGPIAWEAENGILWVVAEGSGIIVRLKPDQNGLERIGEIVIPPAALREVPSISGVAHDGQSLWLATSCGLCSTIFRLDPETGEILQSFFPRCVPRGLTLVPDRTAENNELWTIAFNGPVNPALLSRRLFSGSPPVRADSAQDFFAFVSDPPPATGRPSARPLDPVAVAIADDTIWVIDRNPSTRETEFISKYQLPTNP